MGADVLALEPGLWNSTCSRHNQLRSTISTGFADKATWSWSIDPPTRRHGETYLPAVAAVTSAVLPGTPVGTAAYPSHRSHRVLIRSAVSIKTVLIFVIIACVLWLCSLAQRLTCSETDTPHEAATRFAAHFDPSLEQCAQLRVFPSRPGPASRRENPRWNAGRGQNQTVILRNATLFDGEALKSGPVDIVFSKGLIEDVAGSSEKVVREDAFEYDLHGRYVTPGLVDMHSHHFANMWPQTETNAKTNEIHPSTKALTPMVRIIDALKAYDMAARLIASDGVTSSLIIPGSANLMAGEGAPVKNVLYSGDNGEPVVEELLLERGVPLEERRRYMKMAFGENPKEVWGYTRLGNV